jgi:WXG100 family type VII secretion target
VSDDGEIAVNFATLQRLAGEMEDILQDLTAKLETLYGRSERVVLTWQGEAREMFVDTLDRWDRSMQDLEGAERWLHSVVVNGHVNYDAAHKAVLRGWGAE